MAVSLESAASAKQSAAGRIRLVRSSGKKEGQSPQGESGGEEIRVGQRALRKPYRIERGEERRRRGDRRSARSRAGPGGRQPASPTEATISSASRVVSGVKPESFHHKAR